MINGLGVLGWGVGGIEAEAAMLGQPVYMLHPGGRRVPTDGPTSRGRDSDRPGPDRHADAAQEGVVDKFVEFFGPGLGNMSLADRATIANMAPEYGATCGFFPVDAETVRYSPCPGGPKAASRWSRRTAQPRGCGGTPSRPIRSSQTCWNSTLPRSCPRWQDPKRPEGRQSLDAVASGFETAMETEYKKPLELTRRCPVESEDFDLGHGDVVIAAITSCTNTSNPSVLIAPACSPATPTSWG